MVVQITETFTPTNAIDWRKWLNKFHDQKTEIWLIFFKKSTGKQTVSYQEAVEQALCFGWIDGIEKSIDQEKYGLRFTPRKAKSHWTDTNIQRFKDLQKAGLVHASGTEAFNNRITD